MIIMNKGKEILLKALREKTEIVLAAQLDSSAMLGIASTPHYELKNYDVASALKFGSSDAIEALVSNAKGLKKIFTGQEKASESLQGPIGIAAIYGSIWDWARFWGITGLLSMVLAFMNILPIPDL